LRRDADFVRLVDAAKKRAAAKSAP
jgi:hypothetical protein